MKLATTAEFELVKQEFTEAWNHYRHIENGRNHYLGFFFAVLTASIGLLLNAIATLKPGTPTPYWFIPGVFLLVWVFDALSLFVYASIKKSKFVLDHYYYNIIGGIRKLVYENPAEMDRLLNVYESRPIVKSTAFSDHKLAEMLPLLTCLLLDVAQVAVLAWTWIHNPLPDFVAPCMFVFAFAIVIVQAIFVLKAASYSQKVQPPKTR